MNPRTREEFVELSQLIVEKLSNYEVRILVSCLLLLLAFTSTICWLVCKKLLFSRELEVYGWVTQWRHQNLAWLVLDLWILSFQLVPWLIYELCLTNRLQTVVLFCWNAWRQTQVIECMNSQCVKYKKCVP